MHFYLVSSSHVWKHLTRKTLDRFNRHREDKSQKYFFTSEWKVHWDVSVSAFSFFSLSYSFPIYGQNYFKTSWHFSFHCHSIVPMALRKIDVSKKKKNPSLRGERRPAWYQAELHLSSKRLLYNALQHLALPILKKDGGLDGSWM